MTKEEVDTRSSGNVCGPQYPAVNVKNYSSGCTTDDVMERFKCDEYTAERAIGWAFDCACLRFWEDEPGELLRDIYDRSDLHYYSVGRSGGWLIVTGLPDIETWDAVMLSNWASFEKQIKDMVKSYMSKESFLEDIGANRWAEPEAEQYNFKEGKDGETICLADVPRCLHCKGKRG